MKKRLLSVITALCMLMSFTAFPAYASGSDIGQGMLHIPDRSTTYSAFQNRAGSVYDLSDATNTAETFQYTVPEGGLTVLIFFRAMGCTKSDMLIDEITQTEWAQNNLVHIIAVESQASSKETVKAYIAEHDPSGVIDKVYYNNESNSTAFWYAKLVEQNGDMTGVTSWVDAGFSAAHVLLITEDAGTNYIEFSLPGVDTVSYLTGYVQEFIESFDPSFRDQLVEVTVAGNLRYDYVQDVLSAVSSARQSDGADSLTLSGQLTELAMQRAAELAVYYNHTRPNREGPFTVNGEIINGSAVTYNGLRSENIAFGQTSPEAVMSAWMSSTMGHRENILNATHTQMGVGCFESNGTLYWVQLFGNGNDASGARSSVSIPADVPVETSIARLDLALSSNSDITLSGTGSAAAPKLYNTNQGYDTVSAVLRPVLSEITDNSGSIIATAAYGAVGTGSIFLSAAGAGTAAVVLAAYEGQENAPSVQVTVAGTPLTQSMFTVDTSDESYDGSAKTKTVTSTLTLDTDYTVSYADNTNAGTATLTITGKGAYTGTLTYTFNIQRAERTLSVDTTQTDTALTVGASPVSIFLSDNASGDSPAYYYTSGNTAVATVDTVGQVTPVGTGSATVMVNAPATANYAAGSTQVTFTVEELPEQELAFANGVVSVEKTYGDTGFANVATNSSMSGGAVTYSSSDASVATVNEATGEVVIAGTGTATITATAAKVDGQYAQTSVSYQLTVAPKEISITSASVEDKAYDGSTDATVTEVTFEGVVEGETLTGGVNGDYTVSAAFADANAGENKEVTVTVTLLNENYRLTADTHTAAAAISKAALEALSASVLLKEDAGYTSEVNLAQVVGLPAGETFTFLVTEPETYTGLERAAIADGILTLVVREAEDYSTGDTVTIQVSGMTNYTDTTITVDVTYKDKAIVSITGVEAAADLVYDGTGKTGYTGTPASEYTGEYVVTYTGTGETVYADSSVPPTNAGTYRVTISVPEEDETYIGCVSINFTITKAAITITADDKGMTVGGTVPVLTYTVAGLAAGDKLSAVPTLTCDADPSVVGRYNIIPGGAVVPNTDNYEAEILYHNGVLTVSRPGSTGGGGGTPTYTVSAPSSVTGGEVSVSPSRASYGSTVTITVDPDKGYELDKLTVTDSKGNVVKVTDNDDGTYSFRQPRSRVTIKATFAEIQETPTLVFTDVTARDYYYDPVLWAVENGVTSGTTSATFSPDANVSRAQMVTFLWRAAGSPEPRSSVNPFTDVSSSAYYYDAVLWAVENGITSGTSATTFGPESAVSRAQAVTFLWRSAHSPAASGVSFDDVADEAYYVQAVAWAAQEGITSGTGGNNFSPDLIVSRAQAVTFLYRQLG